MIYGLEQLGFIFDEVRGGSVAVAARDPLLERLLEALSLLLKIPQ